MGMFGINLTVKRTDAAYIDGLVEAIKALKIEIVRLEFDWYHEIEGSVMDRLVTGLNEAEIEILGLLTGLVPGSLRNVFGNASGYRQPFDELDAYLEFVERLATAYKGKIRYWEIWNEQNTARFWLRKPSAAEYFEVCKQSGLRIRGLIEDSQIVIGSLCGNDVDLLAPNIPRGYLRELLDLGIDDYVDIYGIHPYTMACYMSLKGREGTIAQIKSRVDNFAAAYSDLKKPVWVTEIGISRTWMRLSMADIAYVYNELINDFGSRGMSTMLWCLTDFDDPIYVPGNPEKTFGLFDVNLEMNETGRRLLELRS
jgi:hypothetical protein